METSTSKSQATDAATDTPARSPDCASSGPPTGMRVRNRTKREERFPADCLAHSATDVWGKERATAYGFRYHGKPNGASGSSQACALLASSRWHGCDLRAATPSALDLKSGSRVRSRRTGSVGDRPAAENGRVDSPEPDGDLWLASQEGLCASTALRFTVVRLANVDSNVVGLDALRGRSAGASDRDAGRRLVRTEASGPFRDVKDRRFFFFSTRRERSLRRSANRLWIGRAKASRYLKERRSRLSRRQWLQKRSRVELRPDGDGKRWIGTTAASRASITGSSRRSRRTMGSPRVVSPSWGHEDTMWIGHEGRRNEHARREGNRHRGFPKAKGRPSANDTVTENLKKTPTRTCGYGTAGRRNPAVTRGAIRELRAEGRRPASGHCANLLEDTEKPSGSGLEKGDGLLSLNITAK